MKKLFLIICTIGINHVHSQNLKAKVVYEATSDGINTSRLGLNYQYPDNENLVSLKKPVLFHMIVNGNETVFQPEYDLPTKKKLGFTYDKTAVLAQHDKVYYTNSNTGESFFQSFWTKNTLVSTNEVTWKLGEESKKIGEYICFKATAEIKSEQLKGMNYIRPIEAWYTKEIPIPFGIQNLNGLPGLMLELHLNYEKGSVRFKALDVQLPLDEKLKIVRPEGNKKISYGEYLKMIDLMNKNR